MNLRDQRRTRLICVLEGPMIPAAVGSETWTQAGISTSIMCVMALRWIKPLTRVEQGI